MASGKLRVSGAGTGPDAARSFEYKAGDFIVEMRDEWHFGTALGDAPMVLLVIDQVEAGHAATVVKAHHRAC